ncbi:MAG: response regulator receiver protein [Betaproteobacteria bacterium]|nr:response regulator receiver protein [Betaproteobacteria bacterium]
MEVADQMEILLVEDNPLDAEMTLRGLKDQNLDSHCVWVKDGQQALDYIFRKGIYSDRTNSDPRLILLDLKMPRVDGIEVLRGIKADEKTKRIPVVVMTSSQEETDIVASYDLGANSYVVKPIDFKGLMSVARQAGLYWVGVNRPAQR